MSIGDYSGSGSTFGGYFVCQGLLKPRNPECRWAYEVGFGISVSTATLEYDGKYKSTDEEVTTCRILDIPCSIKYSLNPLSTRGKWYLNAGLSVCPLAIVPAGEKKVVLVILTLITVVWQCLQALMRELHMKPNIGAWV